MSENLIYADLNLTESTRPRLQKVTDAQGSIYAEVKVQSLDKNAAASHTSCGKICCSRTCVAVLVAVTILLLVSAVCLIVMYHPTASSPSGSEPFSTTYEEALGCPQGWQKYGEKCYFFSQRKEEKDWNASRKECIDMKSDLVIIDNKKTLQYLISQSKGHYYLLGLTYSENEKKWKWINNVAHSTDMFTIRRYFSDYFCAVIGPKEVETASCNGSSTTQNLCEKASNTSERQKES
ncbi:killer cell lectin-like receptor subfamily B member 1B allele B isoform X3 [Strix aluco]|uniref:killer cell lectin-like receptor subfamily B member 1B allele B isoform X3 n=1 Tax=Strix aluco TaxID=111821 RepID=UPI003DA69923